MDQVTDLKMATDVTFNSILTEIQLSKLNFAMQLTPFAAYITLKRSIVKDNNGNPFTPPLPMYLIYQQSSRDLEAARAEILRLNDALSESVKNCANLNSVNTSLLSKLNKVEEKLALQEDANVELAHKVEMKDKEVSKLVTIRKELENKLKLQNKESNEYANKTEAELKELFKTIKGKEKEVYNINKQLINYRDKESKIKAELAQVRSQNSSLKRNVSRLEKQLKKRESKKNRLLASVDCQTFDIDIPYSVILESTSKRGVLEKANLMSKSLPNLSMVPWVNLNENDKIQGVGEKCKICGLVCKSRKELEYHDETHPYSCNECFACYATYQEVDQHCLDAGHYKEE